MYLYIITRLKDGEINIRRVYDTEEYVSYDHKYSDDILEVRLTGYENTLRKVLSAYGVEKKVIENIIELLEDYKYIVIENNIIYHTS